MKIYQELMAAGHTKIIGSANEGLSVMQLSEPNTTVTLANMTSKKHIVCETTLESHILEIVAGANGEHVMFYRDPTSTGSLMLQFGSAYIPLRKEFVCEVFCPAISLNEGTTALRAIMRYNTPTIQGATPFFVTFNNGRLSKKPFSDGATSWQAVLIPSYVHGKGSSPTVSVWALDGTAFPAATIRVLLDGTVEVRTESGDVGVIEIHNSYFEIVDQV